MSLLAYISLPILPILLSISTRDDAVFAASNPEVKGASNYIEEDVRLIENPLYNVVYTDSGLFPPNVITIVTKDGVEVSMTEKGTVKEILDELGLEYDELDTITPELDEYVSSGAVITIVEIEHEIEEVDEIIEYEVQIIEDENMDIGTEVVVQEGEDGVYTELYKLVYEDEELVEKVYVGDRMTKSTTPKIMKIGKKPLVSDIRPADDFNCAKWDPIVDEIATSDKENEWMKFTMRCETGCNASRVSYNGSYKGLLQFSESTFYANAPEGASIWDGHEQLKIAHYKWQAGFQYVKQAWPGCTDKYVSIYGI